MWLIKLFRGYILNAAISMIAERLKQDKALVCALAEYQANASFMEMVRGYALNTETPDDDRVPEAVDEIAKALKETPFRELLDKYLEGVKLPDFDGDPDDDIAVTEALARIVSKTLEG